MCGFIAQLVEHRTGVAEVMGSNPVGALIFWKIYCNDLSTLSYLNNRRPKPSSGIEKHSTDSAGVE